MMNNKIGKFICELRKEKGLTQKELGNRLFVTDKAVSKWERGLSFPDVSILEKLAKELDVEVSEILQGQKGNKEKDIEKMVNQKVDVIKKEIEVKKSQKIKIYFTGIFIILFICLVIFLSVNNYHKYHPDVINIGENNYKIKNYAVERKGLNVFKEIIQKTKNSTKKYNISYLKIKVHKRSNTITYSHS